MEILDREEPLIDTKGKNLALVSLFGYLCVGITALIGLLGSWISYSAFNSSGAPDAVELSKGIGISNYAQLVMIVVLIIGLICHSISSSYQQSHRPWFARFANIVSVLALLASFIPVSPILLIISILSLILISTNKSQDVDKEE